MSNFLTVTDCFARVDGQGYTVVLSNQQRIDILIDLSHIGALALRAMRSKTGRAVAGPVKAIRRKAKS